MADTYPSAQIVGTDLSPIQPSFVPPNCHFEIEDLNSTWTYPENHFDFIHIRELFGCVSDWDDFFAQAFAHTKPGGYVEIMEHSVWPVSDDGTVNDQSFLTLWGRTVVEMGERFGKSFTIWKESKSQMERAGFVDIVEKRYKWPVNDWPSPAFRTDGNDGGKSWQRLRELGRWNQLRLYYGVEGFMLRLLTTTGGVCILSPSYLLPLTVNSGRTKQLRNSCIRCKLPSWIQMYMAISTSRSSMAESLRPPSKRPQLRPSRSEHFLGLHNAARSRECGVDEE
jgi:hypothetical protein